MMNLNIYIYIYISSDNKIHHFQIVLKFRIGFHRGPEMMNLHMFRAIIKFIIFKSL